MATAKKGGSRRKKTGTIDVEIAHPKSGHVACKVTPNRYGVRLRCSRVPASERDALAGLPDEEELDDLLEEQDEDDEEGDGEGEEADRPDDDEDDDGEVAAPQAGQKK